MPDMKIDSHHHFWNYNADEFGWIDESMKSIRRDFLPPLLESTIREAGVDGVVSVQARQMLEETDWLLKLAGENDFIKGVVGWVPLVEQDVDEHLARLASSAKLKAVRHVLQGEPDPEYMLRTDFNAGISRLKSYKLVYDILIFERHLPQTIQFVDRHPEQVFVLDHIAKPLIAENKISPWWENIRELARRENVYCKMSGMVTEADFKNWSPEQLMPYLETVLEAFGPGRLLFGSDWPVCLVAVTYADWVELITRFVSRLSETEQNSIMGGNAIEVYDLKS